MSETAGTHSKTGEIMSKHETHVDVSNCSASTDSNSSKWDSGTDTVSVILEYNDPFEGTLYRTHASEAKQDIQFLTNVLFDSFQKKSAQTTRKV